MRAGAGVVAVALTALAVGVAALPPVLFSPGFSANTLVARVRDTQHVPACAGHVTTGHEWWTVWPNVTLMASGATAECLYDLLRLRWTEHDNAYRPAEGVEIAAPAPGTSAILLDPDYVHFVDVTLQQTWGYTATKNLWVLPYDFRLGGSGLERVRTYELWTAFVERVVRDNNGQRVVWIAHSNGPPSVYGFLRRASQEWKDAHIAAFIPLSGNLGGQANAVEPMICDNFPEFIPVNATLDRLLQGSWESSYCSGPSPVAGFADNPLVTTYVGTPQQRVYTAATMPQCYRDNGLELWARQLERGFDEMDRREPPRVPVWAFSGLGLPTSFNFTFAAGISGWDDPNGGVAPVTVGNVDGDSNQDFIDNTFTEWAWKGQAPKHAYTFQPFEGVSHMDMVRDANVLAAIKHVLDTVKP